MLRARAAKTVFTRPGPVADIIGCRVRSSRKANISVRSTTKHVRKTSELRTPTSWSAEDRREGGQPWPVRHLPNGRATGLGPAALIVPLLVLAAAPAFAQVANEYRQFLGIDTRKLIWFLAQAQKLDPSQGIKGRAFISLPGRRGIDCSRV